MASPRPRRRRLLLPVALAATLALEISGFAIARSADSMGSGTPTAASRTAAVGDARLDGPLSAGRTRRPAPLDASRDAVTASIVASRATATLADLLAPRSAVPGTSHPAPPRPAAAAAAPRPTYRGRNHVWIPTLRISAVVKSFPCSRSRPPDAGVYRWGCAGRNNVYLLGHAWSTFRPLHDAFVAGRLRHGMSVWYGDAAGRIHEYRVAWWRVVAPTTAASWAWAALSRPSMTLQTCVGANSQYRLMVRLVRSR